VTEPWQDSSIATGPEGFGAEKMTLRMWPALLIRRHLSANWFEMMARVGGSSSGGIVLKLERQDPPRCQCPPGPVRYTATIRVRRSGELFFYVNDAVIGWPGVFDYFYRNNTGKADVLIEPI
jgi:hypothetical protein